jgi:hypothetical protein
MYTVVHSSCIPYDILDAKKKRELKIFFTRPGFLSKAERGATSVDSEDLSGRVLVLLLLA